MCKFFMKSVQHYRKIGQDFNVASFYAPTCHTNLSYVTLVKISQDAFTHILGCQHMPKQVKTKVEHLYFHVMTKVHLKSRSN